MSPDPRRGLVTLYDWSTGLAGSHESGASNETALGGAARSRMTSAVNNSLPVSLRETTFAHKDSRLIRKPSKSEHSTPRPTMRRESAALSPITNVLHNPTKAGVFSHFIDGRAMSIVSLKNIGGLGKESVSTTRKHVTFLDSLCNSPSKSTASSDSDSEVHLDESINDDSFHGYQSILPTGRSTDASHRTSTLVRRTSYRSVFPPIVASPRVRESPRKTHRATVIDIYLPTAVDGSETASLGPDDASSPREGPGSLTGNMFRPMYTRRGVKWTRSLDATSTSSEEDITSMPSPRDTSTSPKKTPRRTASSPVHINNVTLP